MNLSPNQLRTAAWLAIAVAVWLLLSWLAPVLMPFVLAGVLAYALHPAVEQLHARRVPRWLGAGLALLLLGLVWLVTQAQVQRVRARVGLRVMVRRHRDRAQRLPQDLKAVRDGLDPGLGEPPHLIGLQAPLTGSNEWSTQSTPFLLRQGDNPDNAKLNLVVTGTGTVWIDDIRLIMAPLP